MKGTDSTRNHRKSIARVALASLFATSLMACAATTSAWADESSGEVPIYRMYNPNTSEHLYTADYNELITQYSLGLWGYEGVAWYAPSSGVPVYRLYNQGLDTHLTTTDTNEVRELTTYHGWVADNGGQPVFYSNGSINVQRLYNSSLGSVHHLTTDYNEYNVLPGYGWTQEGTALAAVGLGECWSATHYAPQDMNSGWKLCSDGCYRYYLNGEMFLGGWLVTQSVTGTDLQRYYIDPNTHTYTTGWFTIGDNLYYGTSEGYVARNTYAWYMGYLMEFNNDGVASRSDEFTTMTNIVQGLYSQTDWLIAYDDENCWLGVFYGSQGNWSFYNGWRISTGAPESPSLHGEYEMGARGYSFGNGYTCYWYTQIYDNWLFHSAMYEQGTFNNIDQGLGLHTTGGCVRMDIDNAKWIYDNIPSGTKILGY